MSDVAATRPGLRATYRLQFRPEFTFDDAAAIADYLAALGVSHLYSSPQLQATPGSSHGYDVVDHASLNVELGGVDGHRRLQAALGDNGLRMVLDIVPNHMAITGPESRWWWDVLENGPTSRYAMYFDVEWDPPESYLRNKVLLPVLGDQYGRALENGELVLVHDGAWFAVHYHEQSFPVSPRSVDGLLGQAAERIRNDELAFIAESLGALPRISASDRGATARMGRSIGVLRGQLARLVGSEPAVAAAIDTVVAETNASPDALDAILERQNYRLALWRAARRDLGYRRFFGVNTLVGLRVEDEAVFHDTHRLILELVSTCSVDGLRVDHPDGLLDPAVYFRRLRASAPDAWVVAEKILEHGETLPEDWDVDGTTGYDFLANVGGLFVDPAGEPGLTALYEEITGAPVAYQAEVRNAKELVLGEDLGSDLNRLTQVFLDIAEEHRRQRDYTRDELHSALRSVVACMPVYRTYVRADVGVISRPDERWIREAVRLARARRPELDPDLFAFLESILLLRTTGTRETELVMRLQQLTGAAMAKGAEDTAFYTDNRLVSLNEVGGDPGRFGVSVAEFHTFASRIATDWPRTMNTTSTHDTKRGEDVRTRISALSEIPDEWTTAVRRWRAMNAPHHRGDWPDPNTEYLLYQTLVGTWPIHIERVVAYLEKAVREARVHTSWGHPNHEYEGAIRQFAEAVLADAGFIADLEAFLVPVVRAGQRSSLAQLLIKLTAPGVPDIYQGSELWDLSLVDPDNRQPVDYAARRDLLAFSLAAGPAAVMGRLADGAPKLWLLQRALTVRRAHPELFGPDSTYAPLAASGARAANVVAFVRGGGAITVVPRLVLGLGVPPDWGSTSVRLPDGRWRDALGGPVVEGEVCLAALLSDFPVALLVAERAGQERSAVPPRRDA